jgi:zinc transport system substrate-binding protein
MKKVILFLIMIAFGCQTKLTDGKMIISVSILPQKYFVEKIAGDLVQVHVLVPPGASPELYSLVPSQMKDLSKSAAWMRIGRIGFEEAWIDKIRQSTPELKIFDTSVQANWIAGEEGHGDHTHLQGVDPHIWSSPAEVKKIVTETYHALNSLLPEKKEVLTQNYGSFIKEIDQLDQEMKSLFSQTVNRKFLIFHPALTYFARQYGLEQIALEVDGKEPSPRHMRTLVEKAKSENIRIIFIQKEFDAENARQLANEIDGKVVPINPLSEQWDMQLREIAQKIVASSQK